MLARQNKERIGEERTDLIRFFVRIRGARTPPPRMEEPVTQIPLRDREVQASALLLEPSCAPVSPPSS